MFGFSSPSPGGPPAARREIPRGPILASGVLAILAVTQILLPGQGLPATTPGLAARRARLIDAPPPRAYAAILAAPIFAPDRQPGADGGSGGATGPGLGGYAALGAVVGRSVATAIVSAPGGKALSVRRGDDLNGWRLVGVERTRLTFERNGERRQLVVGAPAESTAEPDDAAQADAQ